VVYSLTKRERGCQAVTVLRVRGRLGFESSHGTREDLNRPYESMVSALIRVVHNILMDLFKYHSKHRVVPLSGKYSGSSS